MKSRILTAILTIALFTVAFQTKAETVTINSGIQSITFYPTMGGDSYTIYSTGDVPDGIYDAVVQIYGSFAITGHVIRSYYAIMGYDPYTMQPIYQNYTPVAYPDNDPYSPTFGQATFGSVIVGTNNNNVFSMGY